MFSQISFSLNFVLNSTSLHVFRWLFIENMHSKWFSCLDEMLECVGKRDWNSGLSNFTWWVIFIFLNPKWIGHQLIKLKNTQINKFGNSAMVVTGTSYIAYWVTRLYSIWRGYRGFGNVFSSVKKVCFGVQEAFFCFLVQADPERIRLTHQTSFVRRHLSFWSWTLVVKWVVSNS